MEFDTARSQNSLLSQQNELLRERLESMSDYTAQRRERVELQAEVRLLKQQVEEAQEDSQHLRQGETRLQHVLSPPDRRRVRGGSGTDAVRVRTRRHCLFERNQNVNQSLLERVVIRHILRITALEVNKKVKMSNLLKAGLCSSTLSFFFFVHYNVTGTFQSKMTQLESR